MIMMLNLCKKRCAILFFGDHFVDSKCLPEIITEFRMSLKLFFPEHERIVW